MRTNYSTRRDRRRGERGFSLLVTAAAAIVLIGMLGLAFDAGHMMIVKDELQTFADASAMAAVTQMDGTQTGIQTANATATQGPLGQTRPNGWNFDVTTISTVTAKYSTSYGGTYDSYATASASSTNTYRFIHVLPADHAGNLDLADGYSHIGRRAAAAIEHSERRTGAVFSGRAQCHRHPVFRSHAGLAIHPEMGQRHHLRRRCELHAAELVSLGARICGSGARQRKQLAGGRDRIRRLFLTCREPTRPNPLSPRWLRGASVRRTKRRHRR